MRVTNLHLKNFRCFTDKTFDLNDKIIVLQGVNGSGKTSILESLYVSCYLRSFRTHLTYDSIAFDTNAFFIKLDLVDQKDEDTHTVVIGYSKEKKIVKIDQSIISSFKKLLDYYRVISITEDDLSFIQGSPQYRRSFIDQTLLLLKPDFSKNLQKFKSILEQRNALLKTGFISQESYMVWTKQLFEETIIIQKNRIEILKKIEGRVNTLLKDHFKETITVTFRYQSSKEPDNTLKEPDNTFDQFEKDIQALKNNELRYRRSLFGVHLDDIVIEYQQKHSRTYASRGQQKLVLFLIKIAQMQLIEESRGSMLLLLDDFLTDFDQNKITILLTLLCGLNNQIIITTPLENDLLFSVLNNQNISYKVIML